MDKLPISVWLVPALPERETLRTVITELSGTFGAPAFDPHVTLYNADIPTENQADIMARLAEIAAEFANFELKSGEVQHTENFFKTVFIQIEPDKTLEKLQKAIAKPLKAHGDYDFDPHLSLIYKEMPDESKAALAQTVQTPPYFGVDEIWVVTPGDLAAGWFAITHWQVIERFKLSQPL
jgi:2'-5' RNA ligase